VLWSVSDCRIFKDSVIVLTRENRDNITVLTPIVSLHDQLMCSCDECQAVVVVKGLADILAESVTSSSWAYSPSTSVVWVTPQQVAHWSFMWHLLDTVERSNVVKGIDAG